MQSKIAINDLGYVEPLIDLPGFEDIRISQRVNDMLAPLLLILEKRTIERPILSPDLETVMQTNGPTIRKMIGHVRKMGYPIGSSSKGYYWARSEEEMQPTIQHLQGRANKMLAEIDSLKKVVFEVPERFEQMALF